tara:strand:- start:33 stop:230 length:198 start_codon:yes stop_codon:yes gene_type:complete
MGSKFNHSIYLAFPAFAFIFFGSQYVSTTLKMTVCIEKTLETKESEDEHRRSFFPAFSLKITQII